MCRVSNLFGRMVRRSKTNSRLKAIEVKNFLHCNIIV